MKIIDDNYGPSRICDDMDFSWAIGKPNSKAPQIQL
jgi:hypothetical protein